MPGICSHEFFWPRRAADGRYYQVCRLCDAEYEYDWNSMQRTAGASKTCSTPSSSDPSSHLRSLPRLNLLLELEPAHRVFIRNLADTFFHRTAAIATTSAPVSFWRDVFVHSGLPWRRFGESLLYHVIAIASVLVLSHTWVSQDRPSQRRAFDKSYISYYRPSQSFPALRGSTPRARSASKNQPNSAHQDPIHVTPERQQAAIKPPSVSLAGLAAPKIVASNRSLPVMPLLATSRPRLSAPSGAISVVAPPPDVRATQIGSRRTVVPQASAVAPALETGFGSSNRVIQIPSASIVGPPPVVQAAIRRIGEINIGPSTVVAPAPRLPTSEQTSFSRTGTGTSGTTIALAVPPPPSLQPSGALGGGRGRSLSGGDLQVVQPAPSIQSAHDVGALIGGGHVASLTNGELQAVPPSPSLQDAGNSGGSHGPSALSGTDLQAVAPPPSLQGAGNSDGTTRGSSFSSDGLQGVPPAPSVGQGGTSRNVGREMAMNVNPTAGAVSSPVIDNARQRSEEARELAADEPREGTSVELPVRVIGLALVLPNSSYFSNYEVFIAERRLRKDRAQLIKLVYVSLPYQRRLSEYGVDNSKIYKLRVSRDRSCDESLLQMTWPETDPHPDSQNAADSPALTPKDRNDTLPCYRTTADDYRIALSRAR